MTQPDPRPSVDGNEPPGMPRWVKVSALVVAVLLLLFLVLQLTGIAGDHGPGRHLSGMPATGDVAGGRSASAAA